MAQRVIGGTELYKALTDEGFELPKECGDIQLDMPVDGIFRLHYTVLIQGDELAKLGRALAKLGALHGDSVSYNAPRLFRIVNTDNYGGDYPNEKFTDDGPYEDETLAQRRADELNEAAGENSTRYFKVEEMPYELQPGFEP